MSVDLARYKEAMSTFATGVTVVSGMEDGEPLGFTCQSFLSLSLDPPYVALAPARSSTSWPRIARTGSFCVNVLGAHQRALSRRFSISGGDKFEGVRWSPAPVTGSPLIEGSLAWVDCTVALVHQAGDHELIIGAVHDLGVGEGDPLVFFKARLTTVSGLSGDGDEE
jgi:3-hydroxy-9,10-secoandrosta-1,3,5(10)-triene-9,17-dione monooxygenase reductase component